MARKRAPVAGRKPRGEFRGKSAVFSTRITPELRAALEREAARSGRSLSQEIERRLTDSMSKAETRKWGPPRTESMMFFLAQLIDSIESETGQRWIDDPFTFQAVYFGLNLIFSMLKPDGDVVPPNRIKAAFEASRAAEEKRAEMLGRSVEEVRVHTEWRATPEGVGEPAARGLWIALRMAPEDRGRDPSRRDNPLWHQDHIGERLRKQLEIEPWKNRNVHPYRKHDPKS